MHDFHWPALITLSVLVLLFVAGAKVGAARGKYGIQAPAVAGNPDFERIFRVQMNTNESALMFLPALWLFAAFVSSPWSAGIGAVWVVARVWYAAAYAREANKRGPAFGLSAAVTVVLMLGAAWGVAKSFM